MRRLERRIPIGDPEAWKPLITRSDYCRFNTILPTMYCIADYYIGDYCIADCYIGDCIGDCTALPITVLATMYCIGDYCIGNYCIGDY